MDNPGRPGDHTCPHITRSQSPTPIHKHKRTQQVNRWIQAKARDREALIRSLARFDDGLVAG